jgi:AraC-like DNA-binding protein/transcriptional regulator with XRE-family HTH domain
VPTSIGLAAHLAVAQLEHHGIDPGPLLARSGLSPVAVARRERVKVTSTIDFLERVSRALDDDWLGLTLAANFDLREIGMLYYVAASSQRFGDALKRLDRYERVANEGLDLRIVKDAGCRVVLSYVGVPRHLDRHLMECLAVALLRLSRQLIGRKVMPLAASFVHHRADGQKIEQFLGCDVSFDASVDEIRFDAGVMDLPVVSYDPYLNDLMVKTCEESIAVRASNNSPLRTIVENTIAPLLPHAEAQAKTVAQRIGLSERTFARRLAAEGLSFGEILDQLRRDLALRYLQENLQVSQIAWLLGFHQPSAFSHACRRWTGESPLKFRRGSR